MATVTGTSSADFIHRNGDGIIQPSGTNEVVGVTTGADSIDGGLGNDVIYADAGDDSILGGSGNDTIDGGDGNDTIDGGTGVDSMSGGLGNDTYVLSQIGDVAIEGSGVGSGDDTVLASITATLSANIERLTQTGASNINGTGNALDNFMIGNTGNNALFGGDGNDSIDGGAGLDTLDGGTGADTMNGGADNDTYFVDAAGDSVNELAGEGTDTVNSSIDYTLTADVENLVLTGADTIDGAGNILNNTLTGNAQANLLFGDDGNDSLVGGGGDDTLQGGVGNDTMKGGAGNDLYLVIESGDVVTELSGEGTDTVNSTVTFTLASALENLILSGSANIDGTGNIGANSITGNSGDNALTGGDGNDTLIGGDGANTLDGGIGADSMTGGAGIDIFMVDNVGDTVTDSGATSDTVISTVTFSAALNTIENITLNGSAAINATGNGSANVLTGNTGANLLSGGALGDTLFGGSGNDTLDGGTGADDMTGGSGNDTFMIDDAGDVISEASAGGTDTVISTLTHTLATDFENLTLGGFGNIDGTGNISANILIGNIGDNILTGDAGNDSMIGGDGTDDLFGGANNDTMDGGNGDDALDGGTGSDSMIGGFGDDTYVVDSTLDKVVEFVGGGNDTITTTVSYTMSTAIETMVMLGTALNGTGNLTDNSITGNAENNTISGLDGNDTLLGGDGNDTMDGGIGTDRIDGGAGDDEMTGGSGNDTYVVDSAGDVVTEAVGGGSDTVESTNTYTLSTELENLTLLGTAALDGTGNASNNIMIGNSGANTLTGLAGADSLTGGGGADNLFGGDDNDTMDGGNGADTMTGGLGADVYVVDNAGDVITEQVGEGSDTVTSSITYALSANLENLTLIGSGNISGTGTADANVLTGNSGANTLSALEGNDQLFGGAGSDTMDGGDGNDAMTGGTGADSMTGGLGNDTYTVDDAGDQTIEAVAGGNDSIKASLNWTMAAEIENLTLTTSIDGFGNVVTLDLTGTGNDARNKIIGNGGSNLLSGGAGNDTLTGGGGNDTLDGGTGIDSLNGGGGNDTYVVDQATEMLAEGTSAGTDTVQSSVAWTLATNFENLTLTGATAINGVGNAAGNVMIGNAGGNVLDGLDGNDSLDGGNGADTLNGGVGNDTMNGGASPDAMTGGTGNDTYIVGTGDVITELAGEGTDTVQTNLSFTLAAEFENLTLTGATGISGTGNSVANVITGSAGNNSLTGGLGADSFVYNSTASGTDTITDFNDVNGNGAQGDQLVFNGLLQGTFAYLGAVAFTAAGNSEARVQGSQLRVDVDGNGTTDILINFTGLTSAAEITASDFIWS